MMRTFLLSALLLAALPTLANETIDLDRCIGEKCKKNGRYAWVQITDENFIVYIDPNRCGGQAFYCPTSYDAFTTKDGDPLRTAKYELGSKTTDMIKVYVPREFKGMYIRGINGSDRDDYLSLVDFEDFRDARDVSEAGQQEAVREWSVDELLETFRAALAAKDAAAARAAFVDDATLALAGGTVEADAIEATLQAWFATLAAEPSWQSGERAVEGRLGYESGDLLIGDQRRGYLIVLRYLPDLGWRIQSLSLS